MNKNHTYLFKFSNTIDKKIIDKTIKKLEANPSTISRAPITNELLSVGEEDFVVEFIRHRPNISSTTIYLGKAIAVGNEYTKENYSESAIIRQ